MNGLARAYNPPPLEQTAVAAVRVKNLLATQRRLAGTVWDGLDALLGSEEAIQRLLTDLERTAQTVERGCQRLGARPAALAPPSRRAYCWLRFLTDEHNLRRHLGALECARTALTGMEHARGPLPRVLMMHRQALWSSDRRRGVMMLAVSEGFLGADEATWRALVASACGPRSRPNNLAVSCFADSGPFADVIAEIERFAEVPIEAALGRHHDLEQSFDRVNRAYFAGGMPKPRLEWNRARTTCTFGHYQRSRDLVVLSISLDDPGVSRELLDFVMYHELLHKQHGTQVVGGRLAAHTAAFRASERLFAGHAGLRQELDALARAERHAAPKRRRRRR
jgi:hypothetical protein